MEAWEAHRKIDAGSQSCCWVQVCRQSTTNYYVVACG
jgi:hypothetical protein